MDAGTHDAAQWWARPRGELTASWIANYQRSLKARHRDQIVALVHALGATSVLEVGCHCGPNLIRLAQALPTCQVSGIDVNADTIAAGRHWVATFGLAERITFTVGALPAATQALATASVDVVLSCYALAYLAPADLDAVLYDLGRVARRAVVLAEPMTDQPQAVPHPALSGYREWAHNYQASVRWLPTWQPLTVRVDPVTPPVDRLNGILVAVAGGSAATIDDAKRP